MFLSKRILNVSTCVLVMAALSGCAAQESNSTMAHYESLRPGVYIVYRPAIKTEMTFDSAKKELEDAFSSKARLEDIMWHCMAEPIREYSMFENSMKIKIDSGEITLTYDALKSPIFVTMFPDKPSFARYNVKLRDGISVFFSKNQLATAQQFADAILFMQQWPKIQQEQQFALFEPLASQYRTLKVKPSVSEEQRKYIVQANALNQLKDYAGAIDLYRKAVELDPVSYPGAYFNLALLSAQMSRFNAAITYMKQYLLLEPDAKDARNAQDKIYEWDLFMQR